MFSDRESAGKLLGRAIQETLRQRTDNRPARTVVVAISRGAIAVARAVAAKLCAPLTILSSKSISAPAEPDRQLAVVTSRGVIVNADAYDEAIEGLPTYVRDKQVPLTRLAKSIEEHWLTEANIQPPMLSGRKVILVNDLSADGLIELAALRSLRPDRPRALIVASPVIGYAAECRLRLECDAVVALSKPEIVRSPLEHYHKYEYIDDAAIIAALKAASQSLRSPSKQTT